MNYYEEMEVSINASKEVIKNAYRALIKKYHPDSYTEDKRYAEEKMKKITVAYETLIDDEKRLAYDIKMGFREDPNAPQEAVVNVDKVDENIEKEEQNIDNNEENKKAKIKITNKQKLIILLVAICFVIAFFIGLKLSSSGKEKEDLTNTITHENTGDSITNNYSNHSNNNGRNDLNKDEDKDSISNDKTEDKTDSESSNHNATQNNTEHKVDSNQKHESDINTSFESDVTVSGGDDYVELNPDMGES